MRISGVRGEPPPPTLKVSLNSIGGFRNSATFVLTGGHRCQSRAAPPAVAGRIHRPTRRTAMGLARTDRPDADTEQTASALFTCTVRDPDPNKVGRQFSSAAVQLALASYPGFHTTAPPAEAAIYGLFTPGYVPADTVPHEAVHADGSRVAIGPAAETLELAATDEPGAPEPLPDGPYPADTLGTIAGARSGDKGGGQHRALGAHRRSVPLAGQHADRREGPRATAGGAELPIQRHLLPRIRAINFVIDGILGKGVAYQARFDPQAKGLGNGSITVISTYRKASSR